MSFTLEVEFAGLVGYILHPDKRQIGIVMPDARRTPPNDRPRHTSVLPSRHVGYLRYDLADTGVDVPSTRRDGTPNFEVVYRFDFDELDFGLECEETDSDITLHMPNVGCFAPNVRHKADMFGPAPCPSLLMRSVLRGGCMTSEPNKGAWYFKGDLHPEGRCYVDSFAGSAIWRRFIMDDSITIYINSFAGGQKTAITLQPHARRDVVQLKIANLCADNPMEWTELYYRVANGTSDPDFVWFYDLWCQPPVGAGEGKRVKARSESNPFPPTRPPVPIRVGSHGDVTDCTGYKMVDYDFLQDAGRR